MDILVSFLIQYIYPYSTTFLTIQMYILGISKEKFQWNENLGGGFKYLFFNPIPGDDDSIWRVYLFLIGGFNHPTRNIFTPSSDGRCGKDKNLEQEDPGLGEKGGKGWWVVQVVIDFPKGKSSWESKGICPPSPINKALLRDYEAHWLSLIRPAIRAGYFLGGGV